MFTAIFFYSIGNNLLNICVKKLERIISWLVIAFLASDISRKYINQEVKENL